MNRVALLDGLRVLDLGIWRPAPFATQLLVELGATVVKVEPPGGDPMKVFPSLYDSLNRDKDVLERDLKDPDDRADVIAIARSVDVVIEGFRPGVADRLGVGYEQLRAVNPSVVYCSISGYGQTGPMVDAPGHDLNYQAWAGFLAARSPEITRPGVPVGDLAGGAYAAMAICAAVTGRERTGAGCHIDVSMADVLLSWAAPEIGGELASSDDPGAGFPGYGTFACRDGHVTLGVVSEQPFWTALCDTLHLHDVRALDVRERAARGPELRARLASALADRGRDDLVEELAVVGVPIAPVLTALEAVRATPFVARGVTSVDEHGRVTLHHPVQFRTLDG
jgi:crotonobetainyl-CoA:carnitine CoA-transferase CaiB-like acyl-CoA transferase